MSTPPAVIRSAGTQLSSNVASNNATASEYTLRGSAIVPEGYNYMSHNDDFEAVNPLFRPGNVASGTATGSVVGRHDSPNVSQGIVTTRSGELDILVFRSLPLF